MHAAVYHNKLETLRLIRSYFPGRPHEILNEKALEHPDLKIFEYLIAEGEPVSVRAMSHFIRTRQYNLVEKYRHHGCEPENTCEYTLLYIIESTDLKAARYVISSKYAHTDTYDRALTAAVRKGHLKLVRMLLESGMTSTGPALYQAVYTRHINILRLLLTPPYAPQESIILTACIYAMKMRRKDEVKLLLEEINTIEGLKEVARAASTYQFIHQLRNWAEAGSMKATQILQLIDP